MKYEERIVWQPYNFQQTGSKGFAVLLDREFAKEMLSVTLEPRLRDRMNELAKERIKTFNPHYLFYKNTAFVGQFNLGSGGIWLAVDGTNGRNPLKVFDRTIKYSPHNIDTTSDVHNLMSLFDMWIKYADNLK
jgi:hypothetical protein